MDFRYREIIRPRIVNFTISIVLAVILWGHELFSSPDDTSVLLANKLIQITFNTSWIALLYTLCVAYLLFRFFEHFSFVQNRSFLPFFFFIVFTGTTPLLHYLSDGYIGFLFFFLSFWQIFSSFHKNEPTDKYFNAGFFFSISYFFVFDYIFLVPILFIAIYIINNLTLRSFLAALLGLLTPVALIFGICFWIGCLDWQIDYFMRGMTFLFDYASINPNRIIYLVVFTILMFFAINRCLRDRYNSSIVARKNLQILIWLFSAFIILIWVRMAQEASIIYSFLAICSVIWAIYFSSRFSKKEIILFVILIAWQVVFLILDYNGQLN